MSMSTHVVAIRPPDETWKKMKAIWDACQEAGIDPPSEVEKFFDGEAPNPNGVEVAGFHAGGPVPDWAREWDGDARAGFDIYLDRLPDGVKVVRFYNAW